MFNIFRDLFDKFNVEKGRSIKVVLINIVEFIDPVVLAFITALPQDN